MNDNFEIQSIDFSYREELIFKNISAIFSRNGITTFSGDNGSGKTTLLRLLGGFIHPLRGSINIPKTYKIGYASQKPVLLNRSVKDNLLHACLSLNKDILDYKPMIYINKILKDFNMFELKDVSVLRLSGGQQQIIATLRAIVVDPDILMLDEPTANLDITNKNKIESMIKSISESKKVFLISQDIMQLDKLSNENYIINNGNLSKN